MQTGEMSRMGKKRSHKNDLYYLLPGMGRGSRKRFWRNLALGLFMGALVSGLMWWLFTVLND